MSCLLQTAPEKAYPRWRSTRCTDMPEADGLWSVDGTIWVASLNVRHSLVSARHSLMCFPADSTSYGGTPKNYDTLVS